MRRRHGAGHPSTAQGTAGAARRRHWHRHVASGRVTTVCLTLWYLRLSETLHSLSLALSSWHFELVGTSTLEGCNLAIDLEACDEGCRMGHGRAGGLGFCAVSCQFWPVQHCASCLVCVCLVRLALGVPEHGSQCTLDSEGTSSTSRPASAHPGSTPAAKIGE